MNIKQTNNGVFQIRDTQISESRMIWDVDKYGLQGNCHIKFGVANEWLGYLLVQCRGDSRNVERLARGYVNILSESEQLWNG